MKTFFDTELFHFIIGQSFDGHERIGVKGTIFKNYVVAIFYHSVKMLCDKVVMVGNGVKERVHTAFKHCT